jgi:hypothetical protein
MNQDDIMTIIETKRDELIKQMEQDGCRVWEAAEFAVQEYILGVPNGEYNYHNYHEHYLERYLKNEEHDWKYGTAYIAVMRQLFHKHFSKGYTAIKNCIYEYLDNEALKPDDERIDLKSFGYNVEEFTSYIVFEKDVYENVVDKDWNILKQSRTKTKHK